MAGRAAARCEVRRGLRLALEADPRDHISADEFFAICADKGFTRDDDMRQLGGYLHDLGICLLFQDDRCSAGP